MTEKEKIEPGKYFELVYKLFRVESDGTETLVHEVEADDPDRVVYGVTPGFVKALENAVSGLSAGDTFEFTAGPEDAFGPYDPEEVMRLPRNRFLVDGKFDEEMFAPGSLIPLMMSDGYRIDGLVVELTPDDVVFDFNHPLARNTVHYKGRITLVRQPTESELHPSGGCCCGGCGDCGDGGCGNKGDHSCGCGNCG